MSQRKWCYEISYEMWREYRRAREKFASLNSYHEGYAVLKEELDELWQEVKGEQDPVQLRKEAVQVGAMAIAFIIEAVHGENVVCDDNPKGDIDFEGPPK